MYCPAHFEEARPDILLGLIAQHPLATIISSSSSGLAADHIPLMYEAVPGGAGKLIGHVARSNPLWQAKPDAEHLLVFQGPSAYVSPNWYLSKAESGKVVPTWNYAAVHVHARLRPIEDKAHIRSTLEKQTRCQEAAQDKPWAVADAPEDFTERLLGLIVGVEFDIVRMQGKWKVSQNQGLPNRQGVIAGLTALQRDEASSMAALVQAFGPHSAS